MLKKVVNRAQIKLKNSEGIFNHFFLFFFFFLQVGFKVFFFCRLVLKCFKYREMVNVKYQKFSEIFLTVGFVEPIKFF